MLVPSVFKKCVFRKREQERLCIPWKERLAEWKLWGPYVSERMWGTVREDYSEDGNAWNYFPHDEAISRPYRWGEDAIAGWCDRYQVLVLAPVFWNGRDPILKERLFGLASLEGNHGEDVKECYYHLDATPTTSYAKFLYKYPQAEFPYQKLREENSRRSANDREYELQDTGVFEGERYFDIFIEYAKASPDDLCICIEAINRGSEPAPLHILPHLWFRNQWSWNDEPLPKPIIEKMDGLDHVVGLVADDTSMLPMQNLTFQYRLGKRYLYGPMGGEPLFTENERGAKAAFHHAVIRGERKELLEKGSKASLQYVFGAILPGDSAKLHLRFTNQPMSSPLRDIDKIIAKRKKEADLFYQDLHRPHISEELQKIQRQALSGLIWNQQSYIYDVQKWLKGDSIQHLPPASRYHIRNVHWRHVNTMRVLSMPDKWEYPWFAAWDLSFQAVGFALVDVEYAKRQLWLLLFDQFMHPNGQIPAFEWEFSDLNPPVQAWAILRVYRMQEKKEGKSDREFLEKCFHKLLMNFAWWVNKVDSCGNNVFEGGFLGLDNITVFDRSTSLGGDARLQQSDGTGWMAMFCLNLMSIALELAKENPAYESLATKFFQHFAHISSAMKKRGDQNYEMWSDRDGFFYDVLTYPDGRFAKFRVRSMVGIIPFFACEVLEEKTLKKFPEFYENFIWFLANRRDLIDDCIDCKQSDEGNAYLLMPMNQYQQKSILHYIWDPAEFRSPFGIRSLSRYHEQHPFVFEGRSVYYEPMESKEKIKGGNSNWRGPVWMQMNFLLLESLRKLAHFHGEEYKIAAPEGQPASLKEISRTLVDSLLAIFKKDDHGHRPFLGEDYPYRDDPHFNEHILFYEHFHPESGRGLGASHQTGWTALIANIIDESDWF